MPVIFQHIPKNAFGAIHANKCRENNTNARTTNNKLSFEKLPTSLFVARIEVTMNTIVNIIFNIFFIKKWPFLFFIERRIYRLRLQITLNIILRLVKPSVRETILLPPLLQHLHIYAEVVCKEMRYAVLVVGKIGD